MQEFTYTANPARVLFGSGTRQSLTDEMTKLGTNRAMVITSAHKRDYINQIMLDLGEYCVAHFDGAEMHTPMHVTHMALEYISDKKIDCLIAIGGGSTTGLTKAIALRTGLPQIILPTTYAGSELTPIIGETVNGIKTTQSSQKVLPETVIYDVDLTLSLPVTDSITSGINALAHAVEALYAENKNPVTSTLAEKAILSFYHALPRIFSHPLDIQARTTALYATFLSGMCLGSVGMSLHHKLCHTLGGSFGLPHAATHCVILPYVIQFNAPASDILNQLGRTLNSSSLAFAIFELIRTCNGPSRLRDIGMKKADLNKAAELAISNAYYNPRSFTKNDIHSLLNDAFSGIIPDASL
ncbi:MAG: maleylacetate reductase [Alphaproteobacteria bacterium]|nr:maleylacetate reductase [Alphaproteobacteria bacterium]